MIHTSSSGLIFRRSCIAPFLAKADIQLDEESRFDDKELFAAEFMTSDMKCLARLKAAFLEESLPNKFIDSTKEGDESRPELWRRIWNCIQGFMTPPGWSALLSIIIAAVIPLQVCKFMKAQLGSTITHIFYSSSSCK